MSNLLIDLLENINPIDIEKVERVSNVSGQNNAGLMRDVMQIFLGGLAKKNQDAKKAGEVIKVLKKDHENNLENIDNILNGTLEKGSDGILKHILGEDKNRIVKKFSKLKNLDKEQTESLFKNTAPVFMGSLAKTVSKVNMDGNVLARILDMAYKADLQDGKKYSLLALLDFDKDGQVSDDVGRMWKWVQKKVFKKDWNNLNN